MRRALLITVGTGTRSDVDITKPLAKTIKDSNPTYTVFLVSATSKLIAEQIVTRFKQEGNEVNHDIVQLNDEDDVQSVFRQVNSVIRNLITTGFKPEEITLDFTSGTKAMSAGAALAAVTQSCGQLKYISGQRKNGVVLDGTEKFITLEPAACFAQREIQLAIQLFSALRFSAAKDILSQVNRNLLDESDQDLVNNLITLAQAYFYWESFDHCKFVGEYSKVKFTNPLLHPFKVKKEILPQLTDIGKSIQAKKLTPEVLADMFNNAERRIKEAKYDDAVARFYRLIEMTAQWILDESFHLQTDDVDLTKVPEKVRAIFEQCRDKKENKIQIGLKQAYFLLQHLQHPIGAAFHQNDTLKAVLNERNYSILAHGTKPITKAICLRLQQEILTLIQTILPEFENDARRLQFPWL
ncbi:MAG: TIGR02710 family CRISPR-associated CARF protein [bacterium]|nr:TIGR02710 family CRISPR-associated CARF protein [bacterium]